MDKRFIEESFPVKEISEISAREKNIRHGHISTLHIWWARRPLASSRATNYAALIPAPEDEIEWVKKKNFIIELSKWENSLNQNIIEKAQNDIFHLNNGNPPKVLDPFSGGGAIPLEALRLGCDAYANDYNPVAVLIEKCTLEYPQKYGSNQSDWNDKENLLLKDLKNAASWVLEKSKEDLEKFYPLDEYGSNSVGYIWARTIECQNPSCNVEIPLMKQFWISRTKKNKIAIKPLIIGKNIEFEIVGIVNEIPKDFDPYKGTISQGTVECPVCGTVMEGKLIRNTFHEGKSGERMIIVVYKDEKNKGKKYKIVSEEDLDIFKQSIVSLNETKLNFQESWGFDPIPNEEIDPNSIKPRTMWLYGMKRWGDIFNPRQQLALITFMDKILLFDKVNSDELGDYSRVLMSYLALIFDRLVDKNARLVAYDVTRDNPSNVFKRQALPMVWDYIEINPFASNGWPNMIKWVEKVVEHCSKVSSIPATITKGSATTLPYENNYFDAVFTDPPYYDNIQYAELSDYFYVWLKRTIGVKDSNLFVTPLSPKKNEIVSNSARQHNKKESNLFFEKNLSKSFKEIHRVLKTNGIVTIVYAHKTTKGWETVINALLDSGLTVTASWPISTEMASRLNASKTAALASSIYIIARKIPKKEIGWYKDVKKEIEEYIPIKLDQLWDEGISGADFFISAIGSAIEIFAKYEKVLDNEGNEIRADKLLSFVRDVVADYTVRQILHNGIADELSPLTKFYLMWRWNYSEARVPFDDARKLAQSAGIDLTNEWNKGFIIKSGKFISILGPNKRDIKSLKESKELIDVLHNVCLLWKDGKQDEMKSILKKSGFSDGDALYKVAQAISETLPNSSNEKKLIEGFLLGKDRIIHDMGKNKSQTKLV